MLKIHFDNGEVLEIPDVDLESVKKEISRFGTDVNFLTIMFFKPKVIINLAKVDYIEEVNND